MSPSLKGLQAFEAAARTGSFVAAAQELSVTPAAISQLVRTLEEQVGRKLFSRNNRRICPSGAGLEILPQLHSAFEQIGSVTGQLTGQVPRSRLIISAPQSITAGWLCSTIASFVEQQGALEISVRAEEDPVEFDRELIDFRMSYGHFQYRGYDTRELCFDSVYAVCSPEFACKYPKLTNPESLLTVPLIHTDWGPAAATYPTWRSWFDSIGVNSEHHCSDSSLLANTSKSAIDLAVSGLGIALVQGLLCAKYLAGNQLVIPNAQSLPLNQPYCITRPEQSHLRAMVSAFDEWFVRECKKSVECASVACESVNNDGII